jgi:hypothetical protein
MGDVEESWEDRVTKKVAELGDLFDERMPGSGAVLKVQLQALLSMTRVQTTVSTPPIE